MAKSELTPTLNTLFSSQKSKIQLELTSQLVQNLTISQIPQKLDTSTTLMQTLAIGCQNLTAGLSNKEVPKELAIYTSDLSHSMGIISNILKENKEKQRKYKKLAHE